MLFNSYIFVLIFLPLFILGYFAFNHFKQYRLAMVFMLGMSLWFYAYNNIKYLILIVISIVLNYLCFLLMQKKPHKAVLVLGIIINLGLLMFFKYTNFFIGNINRLVHQDFGYLDIALPLGISFYTFQQISFLVDAYRGEVGKVKFLDYACFVSFFPQLIAGPIVSHDEILPQFADMNKKKVSFENLSAGFYLFVLGLAKKCLIANRFSSAVSYGYTTLGCQGTVGAIITMLS